MRWAGLVVSALAMFLCVGCSRTTSEAGQPRVVPGAGLLEGKGEGFELPGALLELSPPVIRVCDHPDMRMISTVSWNAAEAGADKITIWVDDGISAPKRWFYGGGIGSAETGNWVVDGTTFRLAADGSNKTLAIRKVHAVRCLSKAPGDNTHAID